MLRETQQAQRRQWTKSRPLSEMLPWLTLLTPETVLCKDGTVFSMFMMRGVDLEGRSGAEIDHAAAAIERTLKRLDDRHWVLWLSNRSIIPLGDSHKTEGFEYEYQTWIEGETFYETNDFMIIGQKPQDGSSRLFSPFVSAMAKEISWGEAIKSLMSGQRFNLTLKALRAQCQSLDSLCRQIAGNLPAFELDRLEGESLLGCLNFFASPASPLQGVKYHHAHGMLDAVLGGNTLEVEANSLRFQGPSLSCHMAALTLKEWPVHAGLSGTYPELLSPLLGLPAQYTLARLFKPLSPDQSRAHVNGVRRHHIMKATPLLNHLRQAMGSGGGGAQDPARLLDAEEAGDALNEINAGITGWLSTTLLIYAGDENELEASVESAAKSLAHAGLIAMRETMHTLSAWAGTLPGNIDESIRFAWATGANAADLSPIVTLHEGSPVNRHLSEQSGIERPALAIFQTQHGSPYWFNFHYNDVGHTLVIGPSGSGKSVMMNFLLTRWQAYAPCQTYVFDKDKSCYITTLANGGQYLDPASGTMAMNPMFGLQSDSDWEWFTAWLEILLTHRHGELTASDDKAIRAAVESVRKLDPATRRLKSLGLVLPSHLSERLAPWVAGGQFARWFDHAEDTFTLDRIVTIAMDDLFRQPSVAQAFLEYAFQRINRRMTGDPTVIYLEEAWFALSDPLFSARIDNWLRTLRKKNGIVIMASQNLDELSRSGAFAAISDNMPTRLFLANPNVDSHAQLYRERFGLRQAQLDIIRNATPKRDYLIATPEHSRLVHARFPTRILARLRSDQRAMRCFEAWRESGDEHYLARYENEMAQ